MSETPASLGYRMPAEWEPHSRTWLTWPHNSETWPSQDMEIVEEEFLTIIKHRPHIGYTRNIPVRDISVEIIIIRKHTIHISYI